MKFTMPGQEKVTF